MGYTKGSKVCVVGKKDVREKIVSSLVGEKEPWNRDDHGSVYRINVTTTLYEDLDIFLWDVNVFDELVPKAARVAIIVADENLNSNIQFFVKRWPSCQFIVRTNGEMNEEGRRDLLQQVLSLMDKDLILAPKKIVVSKKVDLSRLKRLQEELASIIKELEESS